jgi:DNA sulfur modification protein DndD
MLLKSLKLKDFRQFKGTQTIKFATDPDKNVTIILGENGSGKTTLAQAFTWCLYGSTDFEDKILLSKAASLSLLPGSSETVRVDLTLTHSGTEYTISSEQRYEKNNHNIVQPLGQRKFAIAYKGRDGQVEFIPELQAGLRMKEILPPELSKYFFFDGERIGNMSKDLRKGKSHEFAEAVRNLLGLTAFTSAIYHLKGQGTFKSVLRSYDDKYDIRADRRIADYTQKIEEYTSELLGIDTRLSEISSEYDLVDEKITDFSDRLKENESSREYADRRAALIQRRNTLVNRKNNQITELLKIFNKNVPSYFSKRLMYDSLELLSKSNKLDKGIPDIHTRTIDHIIKNGRCICGAEVAVGNDAYNELNRLRDYIPPHSLGNLIEQFRLSCENNVKNTETFFDDFRMKYGEIREFDSDYTSNEDEISQITKRLEGMEDVGKLQAQLTKYESQLRNLQNERSELDRAKGATEKERDRMDTERHELTLKDKNNQRIETYKAYAQYLYQIISDEYKKEETKVREDLNKSIDEIFRSIYNGGLSLSLDEKYNVQVNVNDHEGYTEDIETSTAQAFQLSSLLFQV